MRRCAILSLSAALAASTAAAEPLAFDLGEITVSANRTPTALARTGASVGTLDRQALAAAPLGEAAQALARLPGVSYTTTGPVGNTGTLRIRGADSRYIATYFEGIRIDDPSGSNVAFNWGTLIAPGLGRAEVLRGSQSALWGGSAVGGVVTIEGPRPEADGFAQSIEAEAGGYGTVSGAYALTFRDARAELAFGLAHLRTDGFSAAAGGTEPDAAQFSRATLSARYRVSDALTLGFAGFAQDGRQDYDGFDPVTFAPVDQPNSQRRRETGARLFAELQAGRTLHTFETTAYTIDRTFDEAGTISAFSGARLGLAWRAETVLSDRLAFLYGADFTEERAAYANIPGGRMASGITGGFLQALWSPTAALDVAATARLDHNTAFGTFPSGRLALAWRPDAATVLRAALANGFRAPSIDERFGNYPGAFPFVGNPALTPERSVSAEVGVERLFAGGARLKATLFLLDIDNLITFRFGAPSTLENVPGVSTRRGVELAGELPLGPRLSAAAAYTFTEALRADGARIPLVPRHNLAAGLTARLTDRLSAGLTLMHLADRAVSFGPPAEDVTVAAASLRYALTDRADLWLRLENLGDAAYQLTPGYGAAGRSLHVGLSARF
jgi:vitamin B12 transporter